MSELETLRRRVFDGHAAADYRDALAAADEAAARFPEHDAETAYWRACLQSRLEDPSTALATLIEALERGRWWSPELLRSDEDLASLQDDPAFAALVAESERRMAEANAGSAPELLVLEPEAPTTTLVLALHGRMGNVRETAALWRPATHAAVVALPQSSRLLAPGAYCWDDLPRARRELADAWRTVAEEREVERVVLGGFSQGGILALAEALWSDGVPATGFVVVAPSVGRPELPDAAALQALLPDAAARGVRGFVFTGAEDMRIETARRLAADADSAGLALRVEIDAGLGHEFPPDFAERLPAALAYVLET